jgi:hypothetical protein
MPNENFIRMQNANGKTYKIPADKLEYATNVGLVPIQTDFVRMKNANGKTYRIPADKVDYATKSGLTPIEDRAQSNSELVGKAAASGLLSNLDIPQTLYNIVEKYGMNPEYGLYGQGRKFFNKFKGQPHEPLKGPNFRQYVPENIASNNVKTGLKEGLGIDLTPRPKDTDQRVLAHAAEFAGGMAPFGMAKGAVNALKGIGKSAATGATIGGISGELQEGGVSPLVADIGTSLAVPAGIASKNNLFNKFSKSHRDTITNQKVAGALENQIGTENVPTVLENIRKYKSDPNKPLKLKLTTPELAQDVGLSRLYRTQTNSEAIPARYKENDKILRDTMENLGTTGLDESVKGEAIRAPFFERFNRHKEKRAKLTKPLYEQLENIQEGLPTPDARSLLEKEIEVSSPGNKASLERYLKGLNRNEIDPVVMQKAKALKDQLNRIDETYKEYQNINPEALAHLKSVIDQEKAPILKELNQLESSIAPRPIQIENTIQELGDKVNALSRTGEANAARKYGGIKKAYEADLSKNPIGLKHRQEYRRLSQPISEIERSPLLSNFVKENKDINKMEGFVAPSEKLPTLIINADVPNTKLLMQKVSGDKETLALVKGVYMDELLKRSTLSTGNFSYDKANKFLNNKYTKEKINLIFNKDERKKIDHFLDTLERRAKVETMGKVSGSDTHQKFKVENEFNNSLSLISKLAEKLAIKTTGTGKIGLAILDSAKDKLSSYRNNRYNSVLEQALVDPNAFEKLMTTKHKPKTFRDFYNPLPALTTGINLGGHR